MNNFIDVISIDVSQMITSEMCNFIDAALMVRERNSILKWKFLD